MVKYLPILDAIHVPDIFRGAIRNYYGDTIQGNSCYFTIYLKEYEDCKAEGKEALDEEYGKDSENLFLFFEWLRTKTIVDEVIMHYWW